MQDGGTPRGRGVTGNVATDEIEARGRAWGSWGPSMTPDAGRVAFVSDRSGVSEVWVQDVETTDVLPEPTRIGFPHPVVEVAWSADSKWLAVKLATDGGVRSQVWVVRPDGSDAKCIAGDATVHADLGPWTRSGHRVVVRFPSPAIGRPTEAYLANPTTGALRPLASGDLIAVLDLSAEERTIVMRDGPRGEEYCVVVDRVAMSHTRLTRGVGTTGTAFVRPAPGNWDVTSVAYIITDEGILRPSLIAVPIDGDHEPGEQRVLARRFDADLEFVDSDDAGSRLLLVWNVSGRSEIELFNTATGIRTPIEGLPGSVVTTPVLSRDGDSVLLAVEDVGHPKELWHLDTVTHDWTRVAAVPPLPDEQPVLPTLESFTSRDGLNLSGWLYRVPGRMGPGPAVVHLHGGPESQERPTFNPHHQALVRAGYAVFAPNVRGSGGFGRDFAHLDDVGGRPAVFDDVVAARDSLVASGVAFADRIAVTGHRYGGYLSLAALAFTPGAFAAAIDVSGISDFLNFYRETEPWIGAAAYSKYGHPRTDRRLLKSIAPLRHVAAIDVPLLVVHSRLDTNVPIGESTRIVAALQKRGRAVEFVESSALSAEQLERVYVDFLDTHL